MSRVGFDAEAEFHPGQELFLSAASPVTQYGAVFEDDGDTGYFYALDTSRHEQPILDALHIYNVASVIDRAKPSIVRVTWSPDGLRVLLKLNDYPHAGFDFAKFRGYCRTNFPAAPKTGFSSNGHEWSDELLAFF